VRVITPRRAMMLFNNALILRKFLRIFSFTFLVTLSFHSYSVAEESFDPIGKKIRNVIIEGNKYIKDAAILKRLPYRPGKEFNPDLSGLGIANLYTLGRFSQINIQVEPVDDNSLDVIVVVEEKKLLESIEFEGNKTIKSKDLKEKLNISKMETIDEEALFRLSEEIKKLYIEENRHKVGVDYKLVLNKQNPDKATVVFTITEGKYAKIKRVYFEGTNKISDRALRSILFTRENWLLSFLDGAGSYKSDMLDMDKHRLEYFYRDHGYLTVKVAKPVVVFADDDREITVTFKVDEGDLYTIGSVRVKSDELYDEDELLPELLIEEGQAFSQSKMVKSMNRIKDLYGEKGYINADAYPQVKPNEETKQVDIVFHVERGNKLYVNRINITGNKTTRDKVIRRQLEIIEGDLITSQKLRASQSSVEYLGYFDREGANWKIHPIDEALADLEMNVREAKTGNFNVSLNYGSDQYNPKPSLRGSIALEKGNMFGQGWDIGGSLQASRHRIKKFEAHFFDPHIFDSNVSMGFNFYKRWDEYEQWKSAERTPVQKVTGGVAQFGFFLPRVDKRLKLILELGIENIRFRDSIISTGEFRTQLDPIAAQRFQEGTLTWLGADLVKDVRNHKVYPTSGYKIIFGNRFAFPNINKDFSYIKNEIEASYYTALIGFDSLVLGLHTKLGHIHSLEGDKVVPYKELYHMGGQNTVRGFVWGGIGPAYQRAADDLVGDPLGSKNMIQWNAELIFPLIPDYSMKAHVFYDAGAGWDTPKNNFIDKTRILRDKFDLRHSVGFGLNLLKPVPAKIDWGYKLNRKKDRGESPSEFHLSMNYAW